jgi:hypothetical protein
MHVIIFTLKLKSNLKKILLIICPLFFASAQRLKKVDEVNGQIFLGVVSIQKGDRRRLTRTIDFLIANKT